MATNNNETTHSNSKTGFKPIRMHCRHCSRPLHKVRFLLLLFSAFSMLKYILFSAFSLPVPRMPMRTAICSNGQHHTRNEPDARTQPLSIYYTNVFFFRCTRTTCSNIDSFPFILDCAIYSIKYQPTRSRRTLCTRQILQQHLHGDMKVIKYIGEFCSNNWMYMPWWPCVRPADERC